jgi:hypothetical protein
MAALNSQFERFAQETGFKLNFGGAGATHMPFDPVLRYDFAYE